MGMSHISPVVTEDPAPQTNEGKGTTSQENGGGALGMEGRARPPDRR